MQEIRGFEGAYSVTKEGKVYSHKNKIFLIPRPMNNGYLRVHLVSRDKKREALVHRLVAEVFIKNPSDYPEVNHIDCNKTNNNFLNLAWCNKKQNMSHASKNRRLISQSIRMIRMNKERCSVPVIGLNIKTGEVLNFNSMAVAEERGFSHSKISLCISGKRKSHKGFTWRKA